MLQILPRQSHLQYGHNCLTQSHLSQNQSYDWTSHTIHFIFAMTITCASILDQHASHFDVVFIIFGHLQPHHKKFIFPQSSPSKRTNEHKHHKPIFVTTMFYYTLCNSSRHKTPFQNSSEKSKQVSTITSF